MLPIQRVAITALLLLAFRSATFAAPIACGANLTCEWVTDIKDKGEFKVTSNQPVAAGGFNYLPQAGFPLNNTFTGNFWEVKFITLSEALPPAGANVSVKGAFQHIKPADAQDAAMGTAYPFDLMITFGTDYVRDPQGNTNYKLLDHPITIPNDIHNDAFASYLQGTPPAGGAKTYMSFTFDVTGNHTLDALFDDPYPDPDPLALPEPSTGVLLAIGLACAAIRRARLRQS